MDIHIVKRTILNKEITACVQCLDHGIQVTITGGDLSHVGSVSVIDEQGSLTNTLFPNHRDNVIGDKWAGEIYKKISLPVVVTAGVHYDNINKNDIENIINETDDMLDEVLGLLKKLVT
jgi:hypothetical protein